MKYNIDLSIITVGMNHLRHLRKLFKSFYLNPCSSLNIEFIYVDNASTDGSVEYVRKHFPEIKVICDGKRRGFSENNNIGVAQSTGNILLFLNPDIILLKGSIERLYSYLVSNKSVGILVPKLLNEDLSVQQSVRKFISLKIAFLRVIYGGRDQVNSYSIRKYLLEDFNYEKTQKVDWAIGAAMMIRRNWYSRLGGFDERYFLYVEDVDICFQSWKFGKPVVYHPDSVFIHAHQRASKSSMKLKMWHVRSVLKFIRKHNLIGRSYSFTN